MRFLRSASSLLSFSQSFSTAASSFASLSPLISFSRAATLPLSSSANAPSSPPCSSSISARLAVTPSNSAATWSMVACSLAK